MITLAFGCGGGEPTKEQMISDLKAVYQALSDKNYDAAAGYFKMPDGAPQDKIAKQLARLLEIDEISMEGIEILEKEGKFGKWSEVFPERGARWAERSGVSPDDCYALSFNGGEVAAVWDGGFKLIRLDDVGKISRR